MELRFERTIDRSDGKANDRCDQNWGKAIVGYVCDRRHSVVCTTCNRRSYHTPTEDPLTLDGTCITNAKGIKTRSSWTLAPLPQAILLWS